MNVVGYEISKRKDSAGNAWRYDIRNGCERTGLMLLHVICSVIVGLDIRGYVPCMSRSVSVAVPLVEHIYIPESDLTTIY